MPVLPKSLHTRRPGESYAARIALLPLVLLALSEPILKLRFERALVGEHLVEAWSDGRRYSIGQSRFMKKVFAAHGTQN
jgi:hypothetical protein